MGMIDTHAHLFLSTIPLPQLLENAKQNNISHIIVPGLNIESSKQALDLAKKHPEIKATAGFYPGQIEDSFDELEQIIQNEPIVAIGEIGLDYFRVTTPKDTQKRFFHTQLDLARHYQLPVIIHNRHSEEDMIEVVKGYPDVKKVFHCFGSNQAFIDATMGENTFYSFTGTITYAKKGKTINAVRQIPLEKIMIETDTPYLAPDHHKGKENQPAYVGCIAERIAEVKEVDPETVITQTTQTAKAFFNL